MPRALAAACRIRRRASSGISNDSASALSPIRLGHSTWRSPIGTAEQGAAAGGAEIGIGDGQRQLPEQRAESIGAEPHPGQPERIIGQAVRDDRHQPHHRDHAPAAAFGAPQQRRHPAVRPIWSRLGQTPRTSVARHEKPGDRAGDAAERRPDDAPPHAEHEPGAKRQQGARHEKQAGGDVQREKSERRRRAGADQLGQGRAGRTARASATPRDRRPPAQASSSSRLRTD